MCTWSEQIGIQNRAPWDLCDLYNRMHGIKPLEQGKESNKWNHNQLHVSSLSLKRLKQSETWNNCVCAPLIKAFCHIFTLNKLRQVTIHVHHSFLFRKWLRSAFSRSFHLFPNFHEEPKHTPNKSESYWERERTSFRHSAFIVSKHTPQSRYT